MSFCTIKGTVKKGIKELQNGREYLQIIQTSMCVLNTYVKFKKDLVLSNKIIVQP